MSGPTDPCGPVPRRQPLDLSRYDVPHPEPFLCDLRAGADQLSDVIPHVSNVQYVRWLDAAAQAHADALGYTRQWLLSRGVMWFVARHEIDYRAEVWPGDELVLATWVRDVHRVRSWRDHLIVRPADDSVVCRAATLWVLVDLQTRRPVRIEADMTRRLAPLHGAGSSEPCTSS